MSLRLHKESPFFKVKVPHDFSYVAIAKGTEVSTKVSLWRAEKMNEHLKELGFDVSMTAQAFKDFKKALLGYPAGFKEDYILAHGVAPKEAKPYELEWITNPNYPPDLVLEGIPFLRLVPPMPGEKGKDVYGRPIEPKVMEHPPAPEIELPENVRILDGESFVSLDPGQIFFENNKISFSPIFTLKELGKPYLQKIEFPCSVHVKCDLDGQISWIVNGDLTVDGHWSCSDIVVKGNVTAKSGVHLNLVGVLRVYGDAVISYVQMAKLGVSGNLVIERSALQSELRVGGNLIVRGSPGAVMGCTIDVFGSIVAKKVGSDSGRRTIVRILKGDQDKKMASRVSLLSQGTEMHVEGRSWVNKEDQMFTYD